jgi:hypothetical protein
MDETTPAKRYRLLAPNGSTYESDSPGKLGGNRRAKIYGRLDCRSATAALPRGYAKHRVFFADEAAAIAAGYRPCGNCMRARYLTWRCGGKPGSPEYPWSVTPSKEDA